jgi:sirohydrochlorin cobaltochelatase
MHGLLLFAHGARDPAWAAPFEAVAQQVRKARPELRVGLAFLELMAPDIETGVQALVEAGCRQIDIVPLFLGASGHVRRDVPPLIAQLRQQHGSALTLRLHGAIGEQALVTQAMASASLALIDGAEARP